MNRRQFATSLSAAAALLIGCDTDQKPAATATLLNNGAVQEAMKSLASAIDTLVGDVGEFDSENWRDVVPAVSSSAEDVSANFQALRRALSVPNS